MHLRLAERTPQPPALYFNPQKVPGSYFGTFWRGLGRG